MKKYKKGLVLGRFQQLHIGHEFIINKALELCDEVLVLVGSSDKFMTKENPFNYETRESMLKIVFGDKIKIAPLPDLGVGNVNIWGNYVIDSATKENGYPNCMVYGIENKCELWFNDEIKQKIDFVKIDRNDIKICASILRSYMYDNKYIEWKKYVNPALYKYYSYLRDILVRAYLK